MFLKLFSTGLFVFGYPVYCLSLVQFNSRARHASEPDIEETSLPLHGTESVEGKEKTSRSESRLSLEALLDGHRGAQLAVSTNAADHQSFLVTVQFVLNAIGSKDFTKDCGAAMRPETRASMLASLNEISLGICSAALNDVFGLEAGSGSSQWLATAVEQIRRVSSLAPVQQCRDVATQLEEALDCAGAGEGQKAAPPSLMQVRTRSKQLSLRSLANVLRFAAQTGETSPVSSGLWNSSNVLPDSLYDIGPMVDSLKNQVSSRAWNNSYALLDSSSFYNIAPMVDLGPLVNQLTNSVINTSSDGADYLEELRKTVVQKATNSSTSFLENAADLSAQLSSGSFFKDSAKVVEVAKGVTQQAYNCGFDTLWGSLQVYLNGGVRYGNWCGCNSCLKEDVVEMTTKPNQALSFGDCDSNSDGVWADENTGLMQPRSKPHSKLGFDTNNTVCQDGGLDDACLLHDYSAYSRPANIVGQSARIFECKVNKQLIDAAESKVQSSFTDGIGQEEGRFARSIACIQPVIPCLQWNGLTYEERYPFDNWADLDAVESKYGDGCGPTGCYLFAAERAASQAATVLFEKATP